ncbi:hypothetical protein Tco_0474304 [Tanacetum coccineum]
MSTGRFTKPVKAITLPHDVPSTSDCCLIELETQVQRLMEALLAPTQPTQLNKITTLCEICSGPHDTQYCMEDPEQAFVEYASSRTDEAGGLVSNFMASQDARLSKFEADFKQQQSEMTNKIDTVLKAITDRIAGALPSDTVKNPKLSTTPVIVLIVSYHTIIPNCSLPFNSINAIKAHFKEATISQTSLRQPEIEIEPLQPEEHKPTLKDEFQDLHWETPKVLMQAWDKFCEIKHAQSEDVQDLINKLVEDVQKINEDLADYVNCPGFNHELVSSYDDDGHGEYSLATQEYLKTYSTEITPEEPVESLSMGDEHLDTIPATESDENHDLTFSNPLFDIDEDFTSSDESFSEEDVPNENFKIFSNPLFDLDEEITSTKVDQIDDEVLENTNSIPPGIEYPCFNAESDLLESLLHRDTSINDSQKIDSLLDEFTGELTLPHSIPPGIDDVNLDPEGDILFLESLLYDNSSPRPPEEFNSENPTESFSPSPIPVEDSDSLMEEIDIFLDGDDSIPPGIESDDFDSEDDDNSTSLPEFESFHVDYPDSGDSTIDVVEDIPVDVPNILPTHPALLIDFDFIPSNDLGSDLDVSSPSGDSNKIYDPGICIEVESTRILATLSPVIKTLLPFSSENEDKVFNHGVLANKEKSPPSSSHRGLKAFQLSPESPMLIHGDNTPDLGVRHPYFHPP